MTLNQVYEAVRLTANDSTLTLWHGTRFADLGFDSLDKLDVLHRLSLPRRLPELVERRAILATTVGELWETIR